MVVTKLCPTDLIHPPTHLLLTPARSIPPNNLLRSTSVSNETKGPRVQFKDTRMKNNGAVFIHQFHLSVRFGHSVRRATSREYSLTSLCDSYVRSFSDRGRLGFSHSTRHIIKEETDTKYTICLTRFRFRGDETAQDLETNRFRFPVIQHRWQPRGHDIHR